MSDAPNIFEQKPDNDTFGGRFSRARDAAGLTTRELAWRLGVKSATINAWETDRSQPGSRRLSLLSGMLGVSLSWLLHGVGLGPNDTESNSFDDTLESRLERLKQLHAQTGHLIGEIERQLNRRVLAYGR